MESFLERLRCGWDGASSGKWLQVDTWDMLSSLQSRCGVTRAEPACVIDDMPSGSVGAMDPTLRPGPGLPRIVEQTERASTEERPSMPPQDPVPDATEGEACSARSDGSRSSDMPTADREREKLRLQRLLKDFAKECVAGIAVNVVNARTGRMPPYLFQMDRRLSVFSLRPSDGFSVESVLEDFCMQDVVSVFKGQEVCNRVPFLGLDAASCVGIDMWHEHRSLILHFDDAYERDKFYTSLQVLKMSIDIQQAR